MNHKRRRPKSRRAGCLLCKPWKHQRVAKAKRRTPQDRRRTADKCRQSED